jgi:hypothetical protein
MPCDEALTKVGTEPPPTGRPVNLEPSQSGYLYAVVPGVGWECIKNWLDYDESNPGRMKALGYSTEFIDVDGLSSTGNNARQINEFLTSEQLRDDQRPLVMVGYSKGAVDILEFLVDYPDTADRVVAMLSLAGGIGGSPLAYESTQGQANLLTHFPGADCDEGDQGAVESLRPDVRQQWLADNPLPSHVKYYSVVTYPDPETRMSAILKSSYRKLAKIADARNDSQLVFYAAGLPQRRPLGAGGCHR